MTTFFFFIKDKYFCFYAVNFQRNMWGFREQYDLTFEYVRRGNFFGWCGDTCSHICLWGWASFLSLALDVIYVCFFVKNVAMYPSPYVIRKKTSIPLQKEILEINRNFFICLIYKTGLCICYCVSLCWPFLFFTVFWLIIRLVQK